VSCVQYLLLSVVNVFYRSTLYIYKLFVIILALQPGTHVSSHSDRSAHIPLQCLLLLVDYTQLSEVLSCNSHSVHTSYKYGNIIHEFKFCYYM
jgi:hypothetical protein